RDFRAAAYARVLDLHECARLRSGFEVGSGAKVTEWANSRIGADHRVDDDRMRAYDGARGDPRFALDDGERADLRIGFDLDGRLDPGRLRIDDRDPGEHVLLVDSVPERGGGGGELDARVHALGLDRVGCDVRGDMVAILNECAHRVSEIQLALLVRGVESFEHA